MKYSLDEKIYIVKWYYTGKSFDDLIQPFAQKYKLCNKPTKAGLEDISKLFEANCCVKKCEKCHVDCGFKPKMNDERELNEIMVCAAAELELSSRDIAIELDLKVRTVLNILKRNGCGAHNMIEESTLEDHINGNVDIENLIEKGRDVIKWYSLKKPLPEMIQLFKHKFKDHKRAKREILFIIQQFEMYGCITSCKMCLKKIIRRHQNLKLEDVEELIAKRTTNVDINTQNKIEEKIQLQCDEPANKKIKLECSTETPSVYPLKCETQKENLEEPCKNNKNIEFVPVKSTKK